MIEIKSCPVCGNSSLVPFLSCIDYTVSHETFNLLECERCKFVITSPRPTNDALGDYYLSENYISHNSRSKSLFDSLYVFVRTFSLNWKRSIISQFTPQPKKVLDYGCGTGEFLQVCQQKGWKTYGVEPSDIARPKAEKLTNSSIQKSLDDLSESEFDAITLWHVLEHVPDLNAVLQKIRSKLSASGTIFIAVPNHSGYDGGEYKNFWAGYDVPRHLWHFSKENMNMLLENNNLTLKSILPMKLDAFYVSMLSEKYKNKKLSLMGIVKALLLGLKSNIRGSKSGEYSSLIYIVKK